MIKGQRCRLSVCLFAQQNTSTPGILAEVAKELTFELNRNKAVSESSKVAFLAPCLAATAVPSLICDGGGLWLLLRVCLRENILTCLCFGVLSMFDMVLTRACLFACCCSSSRLASLALEAETRS